MGIPFHETVYGHRFFDVQLPKLTKAIDRLAAAMEESNQLMAKSKTPETPAEEEKMLICRKMMRDGDGVFMHFGDVTRCSTPRKALAWANDILEEYKSKGLWPIPEAEIQFLENISQNIPCCLTLYPKGDTSNSDDAIMLSVKAI